MLYYIFDYLSHFFWNFKLILLPKGAVHEFFADKPGSITHFTAVVFHFIADVTDCRLYADHSANSHATYSRSSDEHYDKYNNEHPDEYNG